MAFRGSWEMPKLLWSTPVTLRAHGKNDLVLLDSRLWTEELCCKGVGVFLHFRMAFHISSCLSAFVRMEFMILTADSAFPFAFGWWALEVSGESPRLWVHGIKALMLSHDRHIVNPRGGFCRLCDNTHVLEFFNLVLELIFDWNWYMSLIFLHLFGIWIHVNVVTAR